jgi:hypothetical protein
VQIQQSRDPNWKNNSENLSGREKDSYKIEKCPKSKGSVNKQKSDMIELTWKNREIKGNEGRRQYSLWE